MNFTGDWSSFENEVIDVDATAAANGLTLNDHFQIKFQFYDNNPIPSVPSDGYAIDEVCIQTPSFPDIGVSPTSFEETVPEGEMVTKTLTINNTGTASLTLSIREVEGGFTPLTSNVGQLQILSTAEAGVLLPVNNGDDGYLDNTTFGEGTSSSQVTFQPALPRISNGSILHIYTTDTSQSVQRALNELGYTYDTFSGSDWTGIDFSPYDTVIIGMDGGLVEQPSLQKIRTDVVDQGKRAIFIGGTCYQNFALGVNQHLVLNDTSDYCWTISSQPHFTLVDPGHPLAQGLPASYNFSNPSAAYYQMRATDPDIEVVAVNGDGHDSFFYKGSNFPMVAGSMLRAGGDLIWFINSAYADYWTNQPDFDVLKQIVANALIYTAFTNVPWLSEDPITGTVSAGGSLPVDVIFNATGLAQGDYTADLVIYNNDPDENPVTVPVVMHVGPAEKNYLPIILKNYP